MNGQGVPNHLGPQEVAGFIDGGLDVNERARIVAHVADCEICREEVTAVRRTLAVDRTQFRRPAWILAAAAAVAGILFLGPLLDFGVTNEAPVFRAEDTTLSTLIVTTEPVDTVFLSTQGRFTWQSVGAEATYTLTLVGPDGSTRSWQSRDTTLILPDDVDLQVGGPYYWNVAALRADGRTFASRSKSLTVAR